MSLAGKGARQSGIPFIAIGSAVAFIVMATLVVSASDRIDLWERLVQAQAASTCSASDSVTPVGQASPSTSGDPMIPTYCVPPPPPHAPTRVSGANDWIDDFQIGDGNMARFNDGDMGYRVFDNVGGANITTKHLVVGDHWIDDNRQPFGGMAMVRPDRTFRFENGKLVVEGDVAAGKLVYGGDEWVEITVTTAASPDQFQPDDPEHQYAYGHFHRFPTFGCRLQPSAENTCAGFLGAQVDYPNNGLPFTPTQDKAPCYSLTSDRLWELSSFQDCGNNFGGTHFGGFSDPNNRNVWRTCTSNQDYDFCLDRFRIELTKTGFVLYVNGIRYFEDSGWDSDHSLPDSLINGQVYVYFDDVGISRDSQPVRFHWERLAVNPHNPDGSFMGLSASPSYCPSQPNFTCQSGSNPTPTSTPPQAATQTPTRTPTARPTVGPNGTQSVNFDDLSNTGQPLNGQYPTGVIDWGQNAWWLSGPYGPDSGNSVSFNGAGPTSASFTFLGSRTLQQFDVINGGNTASTVSVSCPGQPTRQGSVAAGQVGVMSTGWTTACSTVTITSSNGWETNFDNFVIANASGGVPSSTPTAKPTNTPAPTNTPVATNTPTRTPTARPSGNTTVTFDDLSNPGRPLNGQYPTGLVDWGTNDWWLSGPYGGDTTQSVSFNGAGPRTEPFTLLGSHQLVSVQLINGGDAASMVTLSCAGHPPAATTVNAHSSTVLQTGWTGTCSTITVTSSNGWDTNLDNLVIR